MNRRHFLKNAGAIALGFAGLRHAIAIGKMASTPNTGFGPLRSDPDKIFDLPQGFSYQIISRSGQQMDDGFIVPRRCDAMAAFPGPKGVTLIIRNHEVNSQAKATEGAFGKNYELLSRLQPEAFYDPGKNGKPALGGTTTLVYDTRARRLISQHLSLAGTLRNCAGGPTPWNSWITCEETVEGAGVFCTKDHGYTFEMPVAIAPGLAPPVPLKPMGRFNHEAVAVQPATSIVYQTEDRDDGLIYRYVPAKPERLIEGGRLQALAVSDQPSLDTRNWEVPKVASGVALRVKWIDLDEIDSPKDDLRRRGFAQGAASFARGEGMWYGREAIYFACTNGGREQKGQIWRYLPSPYEGTREEDQEPGKLELFVESNDSNLIENADNLTVAPWGDLIVCEDRGTDTAPYLVGVTPQGSFYRFGKNAVSDSELAGVTFSPDGTTLFVNIQHEGLTLAITGPWQG
ncbi:MAG: alkaline phosphatase PhoX [bacterium]